MFCININIWPNLASHLAQRDNQLLTQFTHITAVDVISTQQLIVYFDSMTGYLLQATHAQADKFAQAVSQEFSSATATPLDISFTLTPEVMTQLPEELMLSENSQPSLVAHSGLAVWQGYQLLINRQLLTLLVAQTAITSSEPQVLKSIPAVATGHEVVVTTTATTLDVAHIKTLIDQYVANSHISETTIAWVQQWFTQLSISEQQQVIAVVWSEVTDVCTRLVSSEVLATTVATKDSLDISSTEQVTIATSASEFTEQPTCVTVITPEITPVVTDYTTTVSIPSVTTNTEVSRSATPSVATTRGITDEIPTGVSITTNDQVVEAHIVEHEASVATNTLLSLEDTQVVPEANYEVTTTNEILPNLTMSQVVELCQALDLTDALQQQQLTFQTLGLRCNPKELLTALLQAQHLDLVTLVEQQQVTLPTTLASQLQQWHIASSLNLQASSIEDTTYYAVTAVDLTKRLVTSKPTAPAPVLVDLVTLLQVSLQQQLAQATHIIRSQYPTLIESSVVAMQEQLVINLDLRQLIQHQLAQLAQQFKDVLGLVWLQAQNSSQKQIIINQQSVALDEFAVCYDELDCAKYIDVHVLRDWLTRLGLSQVLSALPAIDITNFSHRVATYLCSEATLPPSYEYDNKAEQNTPVTIAQQDNVWHNLDTSTVTDISESLTAEELLAQHFLAKEAYAEHLATVEVNDYQTELTPTLDAHHLSYHQVQQLATSTNPAVVNLATDVIQQKRNQLQQFLDARIYGGSVFTTEEDRAFEQQLRDQGFGDILDELAMEYPQQNTVVTNSVINATTATLVDATAVDTVGNKDAPQNINHDVSQVHDEVDQAYQEFIDLVYAYKQGEAVDATSLNATAQRQIELLDLLAYQELTPELVAKLTLSPTELPPSNASFIEDEQALQITLNELASFAPARVVDQPMTSTSLTALKAPTDTSPAKIIRTRVNKQQEYQESVFGNLWTFYHEPLLLLPTSLQQQHYHVTALDSHTQPLIFQYPYLSQHDQFVWFLTLSCMFEWEEEQVFDTIAGIDPYIQAPAQLLALYYFRSFQRQYFEQTSYPVELYAIDNLAMHVTTKLIPITTASFDLVTSWELSLAYCSITSYDNFDYQHLLADTAPAYQDSVVEFVTYYGLLPLYQEANQALLQYPAVLAMLLPNTASFINTNLLKNLAQFTSEDDFYAATTDLPQSHLTPLVKLTADEIDLTDWQDQLITLGVLSQQLRTGQVIARNHRGVTTEPQIAVNRKYLDQEDNYLGIDISGNFHHFNDESDAEIVQQIKDYLAEAPVTDTDLDEVVAVDLEAIALNQLVTTGIESTPIITSKSGTEITATTPTATLTTTVVSSKKHLELDTSQATTPITTVTRPTATVTAIQTTQDTQPIELPTWFGIYGSGEVGASEVETTKYLIDPRVWLATYTMDSSEATTEIADPIVVPANQQNLVVDSVNPNTVIEAPLVQASSVSEVAVTSSITIDEITQQVRQLLLDVGFPTDMEQVRRDLSIVSPVEVFEQNATVEASTVELSNDVTESSAANTVLEPDQVATDNIDAQLAPQQTQELLRQWELATQKPINKRTVVTKLHSLEKTQELQQVVNANVSQNIMTASNHSTTTDDTVGLSQLLQTGEFDQSYSKVLHIETTLGDLEDEELVKDGNFVASETSNQTEQAAKVAYTKEQELNFAKLTIARFKHRLMTGTPIPEVVNTKHQEERLRFLQAKNLIASDSTSLADVDPVQKAVQESLVVDDTVIIDLGKVSQAQQLKAKQDEEVMNNFKSNLRYFFESEPPKKRKPTKVSEQQQTTTTTTTTNISKGTTNECVVDDNHSPVLTNPHAILVHSLVGDDVAVDTTTAQVVEIFGHDGNSTIVNTSIDQVDTCTTKDTQSQLPEQLLSPQQVNTSDAVTPVTSRAMHDLSKYEDISLLDLFNPKLLEQQVKDKSVLVKDVDIDLATDLSAHGTVVTPSNVDNSHTKFTTEPHWQDQAEIVASTNVTPQHKSVKGQQLAQQEAFAKKYHLDSYDKVTSLPNPKLKLSHLPQMMFDLIAHTSNIFDQYQDPYNDPYIQSVKKRKVSGLLSIADARLLHKINNFQLLAIAEVAKLYTAELQTNKLIKTYPDCIQDHIAQLDSNALPQASPSLQQALKYDQTYFVSQCNQEAYFYLLDQVAKKIAGNQPFKSEVIVITGDVGMGKTHLIKVLENYLQSIGVAPESMSYFPKFSDNFRSREASSKVRDQLYQKMMNNSLNIIDDFHILNDSKKFVLEFASEVLNTNRRVLIIVTSKPMEEIFAHSKDVKVLKYLARYPEYKRLYIKPADYELRKFVLRKAIDNKQYFTPDKISTALCLSKNRDLRHLIGFANHSEEQLLHFVKVALDTFNTFIDENYSCDQVVHLCSLLTGATLSDIYSAQQNRVNRIKYTRGLIIDILQRHGMPLNVIGAGLNMSYRSVKDYTSKRIKAFKAESGGRFERDVKLVEQEIQQRIERMKQHFKTNK